MARLKIYWTETAIKQRNYIFDYWINRNGNRVYVSKLNSKIKDRIGLLPVQPEIGRNTDIYNNKFLALGHYSIFYQLKQSEIIITGFWDNRQDPSKLIKFLNQK